MKQSFSLLGTSTHVFTDNGSQFSAPAFKHFSKTWEFTHITSSPYYPQSNGFIERQVQNFIKKNTADLDLAMLTLRQTPISDQSKPTMAINSPIPKNKHEIKHTTATSTKKSNKPFSQLQKKTDHRLH